MEYETFLMQLQILRQQDYRAMFHSFYPVDKVYEHLKNKCPKCIIAQILNEKDNDW